MPFADNVLREVFLLLTAIFFVSWLIFIAAFRHKIKSGLQFALANLLTGIGASLVSHRCESSQFIYYQFADWLIIGGFVAFWSGVRFMFVPRERLWWPVFSPLAIAVVSTAWLESNPSSYLIRAIVFHAMCSLISFATLHNIYHGLSKQKLLWEFRILIAWPFLLTGLALGARTAQLLITASGDGGLMSDTCTGYGTFLWIYISVIVTISASLVMVLVGQLLAQIQAISDHDPLTGALNRRKMNDFLDRERNLFLRSGRQFSCILIDLDKFKKINDEYGHGVGDAALVHVCNTVGALLRASDILVRYGGEEFLVMCPDTDHRLALEVAERLRRSLQADPVRIRDISFPITASFGVASLQADDQVDALLKRADVALYKAKAQGRNRVCGEVMP